MSVPLDQAGRPSPGIYQLREDELLAQFGTGSARREWLAERLRTLLAIARRSGLVRRIYVFGSFVTAKAAPNDLDVLLVMKAGLADEEIAGPIQELLDHERARLRFNADVFWVREDIGPEALAIMLDTYQIDRDKRRRGIVEVTP